MTINIENKIAPAEASQSSVIENFVKQPKALFIFAHGAGADKSHHFMENFSTALNNKNINVVRFNFPYMDKRLVYGRKYPPNRMPLLLECYKEVVDKYLQDNSNGLPVFIGGKSMGGRVAATLSSSVLSSSGVAVKGTVCIGYPFHPQKKPEKLRLEPLQETLLPILILQGDRDTLGDKSEIENYDISPLCEVFYFEDGDHNLKPRVKSGYTHAQHLKTAVEQLVRFIHEQS
ncbi:alpha/beta family hydrolase [Pseudocolwellia sp. HL-MZ19]|uniref:alpha/beta family hydrolase n=1 Tax=Pseudocolwellia sp. HL-MZ19 TaxID=3400846 RepID=UPI003CF39A10